MAIKFDITGDNTNFLNALQGAESGVRSTARSIENAGGDIESIFKRIQTAAAGAFAGFSASQIIKTVVQTRGEFQQLEVAFQTMLGSASKATDMVKNLQQLAATTPFDMQGVANGAKQLLAYGVQANDVVDTMRRLGDISAGLSLDLKDLAWLYGTTLTQGRMFTMDLRQFQARGIPMAEELAKIFGVTKNEVAGLVTAGKVGSKEVTQAIKNMTSEGSKFGGLMEAQSHTITGQISNIEDTISMAFNDLGKQQEGVINTGLGVVSTLVDHWQEVAKAIGTAVVAYGLYKGALMTTVAIENARSKLNYTTQLELLDKEIAATKALIPAKESEKNADLAAMVAKKQLTEAQAEEIAMKRQELEVTKQQTAANQMGAGLDAQIEALQALTSSKESNIDADLREAVASNTITQAQAQEIQGKRELLATLTQEAQARVNNLNAKAYEARMNLQNAQANQAEAQSAAEAAQEKLEAAKEAMDAAMESGDADAQAAAKTEIGTAINEVYTTQQNLKTASTEVASAEIAANTAVEAANAAQTELNTTVNAANAVSKGATTTATVTNTAATGANTIAMRLSVIQTQAATIAQGIFAAAVNSVKMAWNGLKVAMATNPIGLILTGITVAISLFTTFADSEDDATQANERFGESMTKASSDVESLYAVMETSTATSKVHKDAVEQLAQKADEYGLKLDEEKDKTEQLIEKKQELIGLIREEAIERQKANDIQTATDEYQKKIEDIKNELKDSLSSELSDVQKNQLVNLISDEDIQDLRNKMEEMNKAMEESVKKTGSWNSQFSTEKIQAYNDAVAKLTNRVGVYSEKLGLSASETTKNKNAVKDQTTALAEASIEMERTINATQAAAQAANDAATGADNMSESQRELADKTKLSNQDVETLGSTIDELIRAYNNSNINLNITYTELNSPPAWMKGVSDRMSSKQLNNLAAYHQARADRMRLHKSQTGHSLVMNNGKGQWTNERDEQLMAGQYSLLARQKKQQEDQAAANKPKKTKTPKTPKTRKTTTKDDTAQRQENIKEENERWKQEQLKQKREAEYAIEEAEIAQIKDAGEKERRERALQHKKDLDELDEQKREYQRQNYEHNKKIFENSGEKNKNKFSGTIEGTALTKDQQAILDAQRKKIEAEWDQYREEQEKANLQSLYDYYKEYGSFEQKRLAVAEEYAQKIADAQNEGQKKSLEKERDKKLSSLSYESISNGIDWKSLFSGLGSMSVEMMKQMQTKLQAYINTDEYKNADSQTQRDVADLLQEMRQYIGSNPNVTYETLATDLQNFMAAVSRLNDARTAESSAVSQRDQAKKDFAAGKITEEEYNRLAQAAQDAGDATAKAQDDVENFGNKLNQTSDEVSHFTSGLTTALTNLKGWNGNEGFSDVQSAVGNIDAFKGNLDSALSQMGDGMAKTIGSTLSNSLGSTLNSIGGGISSFLSSGMGQIVGFVAQIPKLILQLASSIKNFVVGILDSFTELFKLRWIDDLVNSILGAISNLINAIFDLPENLFHVIEAIVVKGIGGLLNTIVGRIGNILSFGALSSKGPASWFTNSNAKQVAKTTEKLTNSNEALTKAVDDLKDSIDKSGGMTAVRSYQQAYEDQQAVNKNTMDILRTQMGYHGHHHSNAHYWNLSNEDYAAINRTLAQYAEENPTVQTARNNVHSLNDIYELTPEQMKAISSHNVEIWQKMLDQGKYDKSEYWENYIELAGQLEELTEKINENLTQTSFDSLKSNFVSDVMDMSKTWSDFTDDFTEMIAKAWTNAAVNDLMSDDLKKFYNGWAAKMKAGTLTNADIEELRKEYENLATQAINIRDTMTSVTGYTGSSDSQSASANGVTSITYDQANQFIGLVTAGNIIAQNISDSMLVAVATLSTLNINVSSQNGTLSEIRNLMIFGNSYLEDTLKYVKFIYNDFSVKLDKTNEYLKEMK